MLHKICYMTLCTVLGFYFESIKLQGLLQGNSHNKSETLQITDYTLQDRYNICHPSKPLQDTQLI